MASGTDDLFDDLADGQVAIEAGLAGGAEAARHRAAGLGRHADGRAVVVVHQHGLDLVTVVQAPQPLDRVAVVADRLDLGGEREREFVGEAGPEGLGEVGEIVDLLAPLVDAGPHLVESVTGLAVEQGGEFVPIRVVPQHGCVAMRPADDIE